MTEAPIEPDTKDWTWVLDEPCPECGFQADSVAGTDIPELVRAHAARWQHVLARTDARTRPEPQVWSALEYGCHVRDVFAVFAGRARLMLDEDAPTFENWDQDATALAERYGEQDPRLVADQLARSAEEASAAFASVPDGAWHRTGFRSNGSTFTVESLGRYFVHDVVHHLHDVDG
ncbi:MAG: hypothetical protein JWP95_1525 [Actinotalea sp.]|nr:hypothetical protein [Actinotalea sp.]